MSSKPPQINYEGNSQYRHPCYKMTTHIKAGTTTHIKVDTRFSSTTTGEKFHAQATANCKTNNVVYLIQCNKCGKQYVGETENTLHLRMNGHQSDYNCKLPNKPVAVHFNSVGHTFNDLSITVIEQLWRDNVAHRKSRESYWIHTLRSLTPQGMNIDP